MRETWGHARKEERLLLTGSTGFLGIHLLDELMETTETTVYCLIKARDIAEAWEKLRNVYKWYFHKRLDIKRVHVVLGDFSKKNLGLLNETYELLGKNISSVIHSGAVVKHFGYKQEFHKNNVEGCKTIISFCEKYHLRMIYTSTVAVLNSMDQSEAKWSYQDFEKVDYYVQSKILSERLITEAMKHGLNATILRIGSLSGRYSDGLFQKNIEENAVYSRLKVALFSGKVPYSFLEKKIELLPVDYCSEAIIRFLKNNIQGIYCFYNKCTLSYKELVTILNQSGHKIEFVEATNFLDFQIQVQDASLKRALYTGYYLTLKRRKNSQKGRIYHCELTEKELKKHEIVWPELSSEYIIKILSQIKL